MKIFQILTDSNNVQLVQPTNEKISDDLNFFNFSCAPLFPDWKELEVYVYNPKTKPKNFYSMPSGILVFDEKVLEVCQTVFEMAGEILPLQVEIRQKLYILNPLQCMNGLDYERTVWYYYERTGRKGNILKYKFHEWRIQNESTIFKIPETCKTDIFCFTDERDEDDQFYYLYHKHNLTGLIFKEIDNS